MLKRSGLSRYLFTALFLAFLWRCGSDESPWIPVIEPTRFDYLIKYTDESLEALSRAEKSLQAEKGTEKGLTAIHLAKSSLWKLKSYYIPLTMIRQHIYDAERFYYLGKEDKSLKEFRDARTILLELDSQSNQKVLVKYIQELIMKVDDCILAINHSPSDTYRKFEMAGSRVNLMLLKGELVLSNMDLTDKP